jgi:hypothetical protein
MARRNHEITLDEAGPGMVLSDDLLDEHGQILLPAGAVLTETSIAGLRRREVDTVPIQGDEIPEDDAASMERHRIRLAQLFRNHREDDLATEILRQFVVKFRLGAS